MALGTASLLCVELVPAGAESFGAAGGGCKIGLDYLTGQARVFQQLGDLVAFADGVRFVGEVLHQDDNFAAVACVDDPGVTHEALLGHAGAGLDDAPGGGRELDSNAGVNPGGAASGQGNIFGGVEVVTNVFSGMCYCGQHCIGREFFHFEHARSFCQMTANSESSTQVPYFDEAAVRRVLSYEDLIPAMERALTDFSAGKVVQPVRSILPVPEHHGLLGLMPAVYGDIMGAKLVTLYPRNAGTELPTHQAIIAVLNAKTGEPLALMDGRLITEMRTAAVTAVATRHLARQDARVLAILGSGVQARAHFAALSVVRRFEEVRVWSRNASHAQALAEEIGGVAMSAEDVVRDADVIVTATNASEPVLFGRWVKPGALVNAVGAVGATNREVDDAVMQGAVVVDSRDAAKVEAGDLLMSGASVYAELGEIVGGTKPKPASERTVFKSLGLAVEDLAAAKLVLDAVAAS
jgi:ornithine cyclodeaminase/alanine dehydrogenase-like protein (mu-crystallin family)